jgi:hypothetical protein
MFFPVFHFFVNMKKLNISLHISPNSHYNETKNPIQFQLVAPNSTQMTALPALVIESFNAIKVFYCLDIDISENILIRNSKGFIVPMLLNVGDCFEDGEFITGIAVKNGVLKRDRDDEYCKYRKRRKVDCNEINERNGTGKLSATRQSVKDHGNSKKCIINKCLKVNGHESEDGDIGEINANENPDESSDESEEEDDEIETEAKEHHDNSSDESEEEDDEIETEAKEHHDNSSDESEEEDDEIETEAKEHHDNSSDESEDEEVNTEAKENPNESSDESEEEDEEVDTEAKENPDDCSDESEDEDEEVNTEAKENPDESSDESEEEDEEVNTEAKENPNESSDESEEEDEEVNTEAKENPDDCSDESEDEDEEVNTEAKENPDESSDESEEEDEEVNTEAKENPDDCSDESVEQTPTPINIPVTGKTNPNGDNFKRQSANKLEEQREYHNKKEIDSFVLTQKKGDFSGVARESDESTVSESDGAAGMEYYIAPIISNATVIQKDILKTGEVEDLQTQQSNRLKNALGSLSNVTTRRSTRRTKNVESPSGLKTVSPSKFDATSLFSDSNAGKVNSLQEFADYPISQVFPSKSDIELSLPFPSQGSQIMSESGSHENIQFSQPNYESIKTANNISEFQEFPTSNSPIFQSEIENISQNSAATTQSLLRASSVEKPSSLKESMSQKRPPRPIPLPRNSLGKAPRRSFTRLSNISASQTRPKSDITVELSCNSDSDDESFTSSSSENGEVRLVGKKKRRRSLMSKLASDCK